MKKASTKQPAKLHIKSGDKVRVISGNNKGAEGTVLRVFPAKERATVEDVNIIKKHIKPSAEQPEGGIVEQEAPLHISNLMLIDPATGETTRTGRKLDENGKLRRYSKKTGEFI